tara:strand:+ start:990 stop:1253 length:264 start_codon:yes stop_codon:yes gene_type:complete
MYTYIIYLAVLFIFIFVIFITTKTVYKNLHTNKVTDEKDNLEMTEIEKSHNEKNNISNELYNLNELYKNGALTEEEFKIAKKKILES